MSAASFSPEFAQRLLDQLDRGAFDRYLSAAARERLRADARRSLGDVRTRIAEQLRVAHESGCEL